MHKPFCIILFAAFGACIPVSAAAQDSTASPVRRQLELMTRTFAQRGYALAHPIVEGDLDDGERGTVRVNLEGGKTYVVAGACDQDCTELDMQITDGSGRVLVTRSEIEEWILQLTAPTTQEYRVIVSPRCTPRPATEVADAAHHPGVSEEGEWGETITRESPRRRRGRAP
ncbi:MAG: hypothetical protein ACJ8GN_00960 [Longimicrobiaceae bacterium]